MDAERRLPSVLPRQHREADYRRATVPSGAFSTILTAGVAGTTGADPHTPAPPTEKQASAGPPLSANRTNHRDRSTISRNAVDSASLARVQMGSAPETVH